MLFSVRVQKCRAKKKPPSLAVDRVLLVPVCFCENLPLLHRLLAGMAKVKKAGKQQRSVHGGPENVE
jgi:hypothetical protein